MLAMLIIVTTHFYIWFSKQNWNDSYIKTMTQEVLGRLLKNNKNMVLTFICGLLEEHWTGHWRNAVYCIDQNISHQNFSSPSPFADELKVSPLSESSSKKTL